MSADTARYRQLADRAQRVVWLGFATLVVSLSVNTLGETGLSLRGRLFLWAVQLLPLLIFVPGIWRGQVRTHAWLSFVLLLYFVSAVVGVFHPRAGIVDAVETGAIVVLFCAAAATIRWRSRAQAPDVQQTQQARELNHE